MRLDAATCGYPSCRNAPNGDRNDNHDTNCDNGNNNNHTSSYQKNFDFCWKKFGKYFLHQSQDLNMTRPQSKTGGRETPISARYERLKLAELTPSRSQRGEQRAGIALFDALSRLLEYPRVTSDSC